MRCYDIQIVDEHICRTDPSQKVIDSWVRIKKDAAEALKPSHNNQSTPFRCPQCGKEHFPKQVYCGECCEGM